MKIPAIRFLLIGILCVICVSIAKAGTLDPRLAELKFGHMAVSRSRFKAFKPVPPEPLTPRLNSANEVQVYILPKSPTAPLPSTAELAAVGATDVKASCVLHLVQAWVPVRDLHGVAALIDVGRVTIPAYAIIHRPIGRALPAFRAGGEPVSSVVTTGLPIDGTAVDAMQADALQTVDANGTGIKVGVISDDNSGLAVSQAAGYLPATVWADSTYPGTTPTAGDPAEGTAMLEEVHAMAPAASLGFCGGNTSTAAFTTCYTDLVSWGANVIVDDVLFSIDMFTVGSANDGSFAYNIGAITAANPNVAFLSAAGNDAQDFFEASYVAGPACTVNGTSYPSCMDFGKALGEASADAIQVILALGAGDASETFAPYIEWNDPPSYAGSPASAADQFVLYLVDKSGTVLAQSQGTTSTTDGRPEVTLSYKYTTNDTVAYLEVACVSCTDPVTLKIMGNSDGLDQFLSMTPGSLFGGQEAAPGVLATAATAVTAASPLALNLEPFSAIGPFLYGNYGATATLAKPDLTGIDGAVVSGAGGFSAARALKAGGVSFCGTSATSPNVGALIADLMSADPGQPASLYERALETTANQTAFGTTASTVCNSNPNALVTGYTAASAGAGLGQGYAALQSFFTFPSVSITAPVQVAAGATGSYIAAVGSTVTLTAGVTAGTNSISASNCVWTSAPGTPNDVTSTGASSEWSFQAAGDYVFAIACPDARGIIEPNPPTLDVTAEGDAPPTVTVSGSTPTGFNLTLSGAEPLVVTATSSNTAVLAASEIAISSGCGTSTLSCTVTLSPEAGANGKTTVTATVTDAFKQTASASTTETYAPPPTVTISGAGSSGFDLTLTGLTPFSVTLTSSDASVLPSSGIAISSGCGSSTLSCTVVLTPATDANGSTTITVSAADSLGQTGSATVTEDYSYTPPASGKGGGGGAMGWLVLLPLLSLLAIRRARRTWTRGAFLVTVAIAGLTVVNAATAGTLDPRLAALVSAKTWALPTTTAAAANPFAPRINAQGDVEVYILPVVPAAPLPSISELKALGVVKIQPSTTLNLVDAWVPMEKLTAVAALPDVGRVTIPAYAVPKDQIGPSSTPGIAKKTGGGVIGVLLLFVFAGLAVFRKSLVFERGRGQV